VRALKMGVGEAEVDRIILPALGNENEIANSGNTIWVIHWERASLARSRWVGNKKVVYK
jgi:hypothetical protein